MSQLCLRLPAIFVQDRMRVLWVDSGIHVEMSGKIKKEKNHRLTNNPFSNILMSHFFFGLLIKLTSHEHTHTPHTHMSLHINLKRVRCRFLLIYEDISTSCVCFCAYLSSFPNKRASHVVMGLF